MWLDDIPFLEDPPFLHNDLYGHETTAKLKLVNRSLQQYIMLGGVCVLGRGAHAVSLKMHPRANPTSIYSKVCSKIYYSHFGFYMLLSVVIDRLNVSVLIKKV